MCTLNTEVVCQVSSCVPVLCPLRGVFQFDLHAKALWVSTKTGDKGLHRVAILDMFSRHCVSGMALWAQCFIQMGTYDP